MNKICKNCLAYAAVSLLLFGAMTGVASASASIIGLATAIMQDPQINNDTQGSGGDDVMRSMVRAILNEGYGEQLCLSSGRASYECSRSTSIGEGICLSSGRASYECSRSTTTAEGLCLAKGHPAYKCSSVSESTALSMEIIDVGWAWDSFYDEYKNARWMCRGRSTGQFADDVKCAGKTQLDDTWSGM